MNNREKIEKLLSKTEYKFDDLCMIMEILRGENGCPWDAEQTHESIRKNFIEETYEVIEAIDNKDSELLREELGDVMLQVVFHAQMEREAGTFNIDDVANDVCVKLIHRHPHIFGNVIADTSEQVLSNWEAIKNEEKKRETMYEKLNSVPPMLPALMRAYKVTKKSGEFKDSSLDDIIANIRNNVDSLSAGSEGISSDALGELLFSISALSSKAGIDSEEALFKTTNEFIEKYKDALG